MSADKSNPDEVSLSDIKKPSKKVRPVPRLEDLEEDTVCGIGSFRPQWLQKYATGRSFLIIYCIIGVVQGSSFTYLIGILSTLEKRYAFPTKISGAILLVDEIMPSLLGGFVGYFGGRTHRPRLMAVGMGMAVLCSFISAFPYLLYGSSDHLEVTSVVDTESHVCRSQVDKSCDEGSRPPTLVAVACLFIGHFLKGFGNISFYAVGASFMDDTAKRKNTPMYFAISLSMRLFGPAVGYILSSACLQYYENPFIDPGFGPEDPRWVGAWWLGYIIQGISLFFISFPLLIFPRRLPGQRQQHLLMKYNNETIKEGFTGLLKAFRRLFTNPLYMFYVISITLFAKAQMGFNMVLPKYVENQFHMSASNANLISGLPTIVALQIAILSGGVIVWKFKPTPRQIIIVNVVTYTTLAVTYLALMTPSCQSQLKQNMPSSTGEFQLENECNANCKCSTGIMKPMCGPNGISYFSPCYAGCTDKNSTKDQMYLNCSCTYNDNGEFEVSAAVENGFCPDSECSTQMTFYIVSYFFVTIVGNLFAAANDLFILRSVEPKDKSFAMGCFEAILSSLGLIPAPVIYGSLVDSSCLVWESSCGNTGNCWFYDLDEFKYRINSVSAVITILGALCYIPVYHYCSRFKDFYVDTDFSSKKEDEEKDKHDGDTIV